LFVDDFDSHMGKKLKKNFEKRKGKEKNEQMYKDKEKIFIEYWKRHVQTIMKEKKKNIEKTTSEEKECKEELREKNIKEK